MDDHKQALQASLALDINNINNSIKINTTTEQECSLVAKHIIDRILILKTKNNQNNQNNQKNIISLNGNIGVGKTTLMRYILRNLAYNGKVKSPTYAFVESYNVNLVNQTDITIINHFDLYRFNNQNQWLEYGFDEYCNNVHSLNFIEWIDMAVGCINIDRILMTVNIESNILQHRTIGITHE
jgi:tRNA threonylcarbamoyl adenosine modification protein YjeE